MEHTDKQSGAAVLSRPVKGPDGITRWPRSEPIRTQRDAARERNLQRALNAEHALRVEHEAQILALKRALASVLGSPRSAGWRGVICHKCGCLCKPRETCPMCAWNRYEKERRTS